MPGITINFTEEEYAKIPAPKRAWVRELVQKALVADMDAVRELVVGIGVEVPVVKRYVFRHEGQTVIGVGLSPAAAALQAGLPKDPMMEWLPWEAAQANGWVE